MKTVSMLSTAACALLLALPAFAASTTPNNPAKTTAVQSVWPAEKLAGTITMVLPEQHLVVINDGGVPFDMVIGGNTRIESGNHAVTMQDLQQDLNHNVSVKFIPERRGDVARSIQLNG